MKYYVYSGYISPDNCDGERETHTLEVFDTPEQVLKFKKEFDQNIHEECGHIVFNVIEGREVFFKAKKTVTEWELV